MLRNLLVSMFAMVVCISLVAADEFSAVVTKADADKGTVSFFKTKKGKKDGDEMTLPLAKDAKVAQGKKDDTKKFVAGDKIEGGLKASVFQKIGDKGVSVRITTADDNKSVTQLLVTQKKK